MEIFIVAVIIQILSILLARDKDFRRLIDGFINSFYPIVILGLIYYFAEIEQEKTLAGAILLAALFFVTTFKEEASKYERIERQNQQHQKEYEEDTDLKWGYSPGKGWGFYF